MVTYIRVGLGRIGGKMLQVVKMAVMMSAILGSCSRDKFIKCLHLLCHIFHLVFHYTNSLLMNSLGSILNRCMLFIDFL